MENLAPPLVLLLSVRRALERGQSVRTGVLHFFNQHFESVDTQRFAAEVARWWACKAEGQVYDYSSLNIYRKSLLKLLDHGLSGESIFVPLCDLEEDVTLACIDEIDQTVVRLPFLLLIPLLFFQFPAFLLLLFGPLLKNLFYSF